jgi:hypothetical protein
MHLRTKLRLHRETLRALQPDSLQGIVLGGFEDFGTTLAGYWGISETTLAGLSLGKSGLGGCTTSSVSGGNMGQY